MPGIHHRARRHIGAGFDTKNVFAELISDGKHIHPSAVRMLIKLYGVERVILISDAMRAAGLGDGEYEFGGQTMTVKNATALTPTGNLAGSTATLLECVRCAVSFGIPKNDAFKMASENPARLMGLNKGKVEAGLDADLIFTDAEYNLVGVMKGGEFYE
jgi:N-acetylglucosamine-6-phosphate deacetylase